MATRNAEIPPTTHIHCPICGGPHESDFHALPHTPELARTPEVETAQPVAPVEAVLPDVPAARPAWAIEVDELVARRSKAAKSERARRIEAKVGWLRSRRAAAVVLLSAAGGLAAGGFLSSRTDEQGIASGPARENPQAVEGGRQSVAGGSPPMEFAAPRDVGSDVAAASPGSGARTEAVQVVDGGAQLGGVAAAVPGNEPAPSSVPEVLAPEVLTPQVAVPEVAVPLGPTVSSTSFEAEPSANLLPPPITTTENRPTDGRSLAAVDTPPTLVNTSRIQALIPQYHPQILKDVGLGGSVEMWLYVDESGAVARHEVRTSSGNDLLDAAAGRIVSQMRFSPAMNRDQATAVWVRQQLTFPSGP